jgi:hypothetical protein
MVCSSTMKIEVTYFSKMSVDFQWTGQCYIPEDKVLDNRCCENLKSYISEEYALFVFGIEVILMLKMVLECSSEMLILIRLQHHNTNLHLCGYLRY